MAAPNDTVRSIDVLRPGNTGAALPVVFVAGPFTQVGGQAANRPNSRVLPVANESRFGIYQVDDKRVMVPLAIAQDMLSWMLLEDDTIPADHAEAHLHDGTVLRRTVEAGRGSEKNFASDADVVAKFPTRFVGLACDADAVPPAASSPTAVKTSSSESGVSRTARSRIGSSAASSPGWSCLVAMPLMLPHLRSNRNPGPVGGA